MMNDVASAEGFGRVDVVVCNAGTGGAARRAVVLLGKKMPGESSQMSKRDVKKNFKRTQQRENNVEKLPAVYSPLFCSSAARRRQAFGWNSPGTD